MPMTQELRQKVDQIRDDLYGGGYPDPVSNAEQLSFLFFFYLVEGIDAQNAARARVLKHRYDSLFAGTWKLRNPVNATKSGQKSISAERLKWSVWARGLSGENLVRFVRDEVFPFFSEIAANSAVNFMDGARLGIDDPAVLAKVTSAVDALRLDEADADTKGDLFEHILRQIKQAGELGQFRTPRHIIRAVVELANPEIGETVYDPAAGTAGFLVAAYNHIRLANSSDAATEVSDQDGKPQLRGLGDKLSRTQQNQLLNGTFFGNDVDPKMVRLATMNLTLRGLPNVRILRRNVLTSTIDAQQREELCLPAGYDVILANPPFSGRIDRDRVVEELRVGSSSATELLFVKYMMESLSKDGRCAVIVPEGIVRAEAQANIEVRRQLLENFRLEGVIALPHFVFKPYASVATFVLIFSKSKPAKRVWMYHVSADGYSPDSLRTPITTDDLPDLVEQWNSRLKKSYKEKKGVHGWVDVEEIRNAEFSLVPKTHLLHRQHEATRYPLRRLGVVCHIQKGNLPAARAEPGKFPFFTTAEKVKTTSVSAFEGESVCVPLVSSTGHGHASIKRLHLAEGKFSAASIVAVLQPKDPSKVSARYLYFLLSALKEDVLVPLMRGAANVSLSVDTIAKIEVPIPDSLEEQLSLIDELDRNRQRRDELATQMSSLTSDYDEAIALFPSQLRN